MNRLCLMFWLCIGVALATPSRVGGGTNSAIPSTTSIAVTYTPTVGHGAAVTMGWGSSSVTCSSITETNCTWTLVARSQDATAGVTVEVWYCASVGASPGGTVTANLSGSVRRRAMALEEYDTSFTAVDTNATNSEHSLAGAAHTCASGTTGAVGWTPELWVAGFYSSNSDGSTTQAETSPSGSFLVTQNPTGLDAVQSNEFGCGLVDQIASTSPSSVSATVSISCTGYTGVMVLLKFTGGSAPATTTSTGMTMTGVG